MLTVLVSSRCNIQLITKIIVCRTLITSPFKNSFQERILNYFESTLKAQRPYKKDEKGSPFKDTGSSLNDKVFDNIFKSDTEKKFKSICKEIENVPSIEDEQIKDKVMRDLDEKCYQHLNDFSNAQILVLLNAFSKVCPITLSRSYFYDKSISILIKSAESQVLNSSELVQLLFYISLRRETAADYIDYLKPYLPKLEELPLIEKCITAQSFEKSSATLPSNKRKQFEKLIEEEFEELIADPNLLITLSKSLINSDESTDLTLKTLSQSIVKLQIPLDFKTNVHVLSLYAVALVFEPQAIDHLVKNSIQIVENDLKGREFKLDLRDFTSFLWSLSYLGLTLNLNEKLVLRTYMEERVKEYKLKENINLLVETILYLHMLRSWSTRTLKSCLQERKFNSIFQHSWKARTKMQLLVTQITMEMKMYVPHSLKRKVSISYTPSQKLKALEQIATGFVEEGILESAVIECPIETLIIPGVTMRTKRSTFHVDILDDSTCLRNTHIPHGLMNLKLRLLSRLRYRQILVNGKLFDHLDTQRSQIQRQLLRSIKHGKAATLFDDKNEEL